MGLCSSRETPYRLRHHCTNAFYSKLDPRHCYRYALFLHEELGMSPVICHGDLWVGNMMFTKAEDKDGKTIPSDELLALFDWQVRIRTVHI